MSVTEQQHFCRICKQPLTDENWQPYDRKGHRSKKNGKVYQNYICKDDKNKHQREKNAKKHGKVLEEPIQITNTPNRTPTVVEKQQETAEDWLKEIMDFKTKQWTPLSKAIEKAEEYGKKQVAQKFKEFNKVKNKEKVEEFKGYVKKVEHKDKNWERIKAIFVDNNIDSVEKGFEIKEMALAWKEYFGWNDISLIEMKGKIKRMITTANQNGARIRFHKLDNGIYKWYIVRDPKGYKNPKDTEEGLKKNMQTGIDTLEAEEKQLEEEIKNKAEEEERKNKELVVDAATGQEETQNKNEGSEEDK